MQKHKLEFVTYLETTASKIARCKTCDGETRYYYKPALCGGFGAQERLIASARFDNDNRIISVVRV